MLSWSSILPQNWLPLEVGNKWQYINFDFGGSFTMPDTNYFNVTISYSEIFKDTVINNNIYYSFSPIAADWFRFSAIEQKIFYWYENEDKLVMDFTLPSDSFFISYLPNPFSTIVTANSISGNYWLFDSLFFYKGFHWFVVIDGSTGQTIKYIPNFGVVADSFYYYDNASLGYIKVVRKLVQANISGNNIRGNDAPSIFLDPIFSLPDSNFTLNILVTHPYNIFFPSNPSFNGLNYIDSVQLYSYYSKEDLIVQNQSIQAVNNGRTEEWEIDTFLNSQLLRDGFSFNYKIEAKDKGLVPQNCFAPDTGYFIATYDTTTGLVSNSNILLSFRLYQNFPNPFNPNTKIKFEIPESGFVSLKVYDVIGNEMTSLINEEKQIGTYEVNFDASGLTSGVYYYQLRQGNFIETKKTILIK